MSDLHHDHDGDNGLAETASALSRALADRAAEVEPSANAYANLATKVTAASSPRGGFRSGWSLGRLGAIAVTGVVVVAVGIGIAAVNSGDDPTGLASVEIGSPASSTIDPAGVDPTGDGTDGGADDAGDTPGSSLPVPTVPSGIEQIPATPDMISDLTLARPTRDEAVMAFFDLLGVEFVDYEIQGEQVSVWTFREGSTERGPDVANLQLGSVELDEGPGWMVVEALSDQVVIESPTPSTALSGQSELVVSGRGTGFEATLGVELVSATDGSALFDSYANAGNFGELAPFETSIPLVGTERAWLVVTSSGGASQMAEPFAAVPVSYQGAVDDTDYVVVRISEDDPDGGLILRAGPGTSNPRLATIPPGGAVKRRSGAYPTRNGSTVWWPVVAAGNEGWMSSAFLADPGPEPNATYRQAADNVLWQLADPGRIGSWFPVSPAHGFTLFSGGTRVRLTAQQLRAGALWDTRDPDLGRSPLDELGVPSDPSAPGLEITVNQAQFVDSASRELADGYFGGLPSATASYEGTDGEPRLTHVFFATGADGEVVAIGAIVETG